jgi:hypothetical protein
MCTCTKRTENVNMSEIDKETKAILRYIAQHPASSEYRIYQEVVAELKGKCRTKKEKDVVKFSRISVLRKVTMLQNKHFLRLEKGPRNAYLSWLTVKGLIYALQCHAIEPEDAQEIEKKHNLNIPCKAHSENCFVYVGPTLECELVKNFKDGNPAVFFMLLSHIPKILDAEEHEMSLFSCLSGILGSIYLYITDSRFRDKCYHEQEISIGCGDISNPEEGTCTYFLSPIGEIMLRSLGIDLPKGWKRTIKQEAQKIYREEWYQTRIRNTAKLTSVP